MANPQLEAGYTRIANELLEAISRKELNGVQIRVLLLFLRQSYGYGKKTAPLSADYIQKHTGTGKRYAQKVVKSLIDGRILLVESEATFSSPRELSINKNWEEWEAVKPQGGDNDAEVQSGRTTEVQSGRTTEVQSDAHKRKNKEKNKENICAPEGAPPSQKEAMKETQERFEHLWKLYPCKKGKGKISDACKKKLHQVPLEEMERAILRYKQYVSGLEYLQYQNGSTFFHTGYIDYLDKNYSGGEDAGHQRTVPAPDRQPDVGKTVGLPPETLQGFIKSGIIDADGNIDCYAASKNQIRILQEAGLL